MSEAEEHLLRENLRLAKENNQMLRALHRAMWWSRVASIVYWALLIGSLFGLYYLFQPFIDEGRNIFKDFASPGNEVKSLLLRQIEGQSTFDASQPKVN
jgi:hypothetical protein